MIPNLNPKRNFHREINLKDNSYRKNETKRDKKIRKKIRRGKSKNSPAWLADLATMNSVQEIFVLNNVFVYSL